jgi:hypothetical protein
MSSLVVVRHRHAPIIGSCGVFPDRRFGALETDLDWLAMHGIAVERIDPVTDPEALDRFPRAAQLWRDEGVVALPLLLIDGRVCTRGHLPSHDELVRLTAALAAACSVETLRHVAAVAATAALGLTSDLGRERAAAGAAGLDAARLDAVEDEARRVAEQAALAAR